MKLASPIVGVLCLASTLQVDGAGSLSVMHWNSHYQCWNPKPGQDWGCWNMAEKWINDQLSNSTLDLDFFSGIMWNDTWGSQSPPAGWGVIWSKCSKDNAMITYNDKKWNLSQGVQAKQNGCLHPDPTKPDRAIAAARFQPKDGSTILGGKKSLVVIVAHFPHPNQTLQPLVEPIITKALGHKFDPTSDEVLVLTDCNNFNGSQPLSDNQWILDSLLTDSKPKIGVDTPTSGSTCCSNGWDYNFDRIMTTLTNVTATPKGIQGRSGANLPLEIKAEHQNDGEMVFHEPISMSFTSNGPPLDPCAGNGPCKGWFLA